MYPFGKNVRMHLYGRGHGDSVGCILEGIPADIEVSMDDMEKEMDLRRPRSLIGTARKEADDVNILYGVHDGRTTGSPILIDIPNTDISGTEYNGLPRPGHADLPAYFKFRNYDSTGGGQFSGRLTAPIVAAGSIAKSFLRTRHIDVAGFTRSVGSVRDTEVRDADDAFGSRSYATRACTKELDKLMIEEIVKASEQRDSVGGIAECIVSGLRSGDGGIWFDSLDSELSGAMFSIPGVKGVEFGDGFRLAEMKGSESNDPFAVVDNEVVTKSNRMGGILGGMSTGMPLVFRVAFKPTPSIGRPQDTVDLSNMENAVTEIKGRHDPCIVPRAVSVVEAMAALVIADQVIRWKSSERE